MRNFDARASKFRHRFFREFETGRIVRPKTEELLYLLLWSCDTLTQPTYRNLTGSFEGWAYRNGFHRHLAELQRKQLLEARTSKRARPDRTERVLRLTERGRLHALGGRDPQLRWRRRWDRRWRLVLFDLPVTQNTLRNRLRKELRRQGFGCLQESVWITPDALDEQKSALINSRVDVGTLILLEARACAGESDQEIVTKAWDFAAINRAYARQTRLLEEAPIIPLRNERDARSLRAWAAEERSAWRAAITLDPFLPEQLLPREYLGKRTWQLRIKVLREAGQELRAFSGETGA